MRVQCEDSIAQRFDAALHCPVRQLFAVVFQAQALGSVAHFGFKHAIEATQRMFDNSGAGRAVHAFDAQALMHVALVNRGARRRDQLADFNQADPLRIIMQAQPRLAVFANDVRLVKVLVLKQRNQSFDAGIPLVRDMRQYERQVEYQFFNGHRGQHTVAEEKPDSTVKCRQRLRHEDEPLEDRSS